MPKRSQIKTHNLARLMLYILGHSPDEFGLVPDWEGFVSYKELLWAIHEEPGWGYVRRGHINEVLLGNDRALFQPEENRIRALDRRWHLDLENPSQALPKALFIGVRRRAHSTVMEKGLRSIEGSCVVLLSDRDMAMRIGRRRDQKPVLLEIMVPSASKAGILFYPFGSLFLTHQVPARFITGPPVSKEDLKGTGSKEGKRQEGSLDFEPGTFVFDLSRDPDLSRRAKGKKRKGWKEKARKIRREKRR